MATEIEILAAIASFQGRKRTNRRYAEEIVHGAKVAGCGRALCLASALLRVRKRLRCELCFEEIEG